VIVFDALVRSSSRARLLELGSVTVKSSQQVSYVSSRASHQPGDLGVRHLVDVVIDHGLRHFVGEGTEEIGDDAASLWARGEASMRSFGVSVLQKSHSVSGVPQMIEASIRRCLVQERHCGSVRAELLGSLHEGREHVLEHFLRVGIVAEDRPGPPQHGGPVGPVERLDVDGSVHAGAVLGYPG
jgi:hypothetical protein